MSKKDVVEIDPQILNDIFETPLGSWEPKSLGVDDLRWERNRKISLPFHTMIDWVAPETTKTRVR